MKCTQCNWVYELAWHQDAAGRIVYHCANCDAQYEEGGELRTPPPSRRGDDETPTQH